jgi:hypothetical protein
MIFITAKFRIRPEHARVEGPVILCFGLMRPYKGIDVLLEAFRDDEAGAAHVRSEHFRAATQELPAYLAETPLIVNAQVPGTDWSELGELAVEKS